MADPSEAIVQSWGRSVASGVAGVNPWRARESRLFRRTASMSLGKDMHGPDKLPSWSKGWSGVFVSH